MKIDIIKDFERYLNNKDLSESSVKLYIYTVSRLFGRYIEETFDIPLTIEGVQNIKGYMISNWATSLMTKKVSTRALNLVIIKTFLLYLFKMQFINFDLSTALPDIPNIERHHTIHPDEYTPKRNYSEDELTKLMNTCPTNTFVGLRNRAIIAVAVMTGLRASELCALTIGHVFGAENTVTIPRKGTHGNKVKVFIPVGVREHILPYIEMMRKSGIRTDNAAPLFVSRKGAPFDRMGIYQSLSYAEKKAGVPTGVHTLRHTALSRVAKDENSAVARDIAGHKSLTVINRYIHTSDEELIHGVNSLSDWFNNL